MILFNDVNVSSVMTYLFPHFLVLMIGWKMTLGPAALFFHKLNFFNFFRTKVFNTNQICDSDVDEKCLTINAYQLIKIPFVQEFFLEMSLIFVYSIFYGSFYIGFKRYPDPDFSLIMLSIISLYIPCMKLINQVSGLYKSWSILAGFFCLIIPFINIIFDINGTKSLDLKSKILLILCCYLQGFFLSVSPITNGMNLYRYNNQLPETINFKGFHSILLNIYSNFSMLVINSSSILNISIPIIYYILYYRRRDLSDMFLFIGVLICSVLYLVFTRKMLLMRLVHLLAPVFVSSKDSDQKELKDLISPIGKILFASMCNSCSQSLYLFSFIQVKFLQSDKLASHAFITCLLLNGQLLSSTQFFVFIYKKFMGGY